jgi:hypothetical protein
MSTLWGQVLMFICRFVVYVSKVFRTAKLFASNASAPMNKLQKMAWGTEIASEKEGLQQCEH